MLIVNLAGRFLLELAAIGSVGYWGFQVGGASPIRILVAAGAMALLVLVWAFVIAPNADNRIDPDVRIVIGSAVLLLASGALAAAGQPTLGARLRRGRHRQHGPALRARARYARNPRAERLTCNSHRPSTGSATGW